MTLAFVPFWIIMIIFRVFGESDLLMDIMDKNIEMYKNVIKELHEDLGHLENEEDLTFTKDSVNVEE